MSLSYILNQPAVWRVFRKTLDLLFGLYRKRTAVLRSFGVTRETKIIDVACGTGEYSAVTDADYLGVDLNAAYIKTAEGLYGSAIKRFLAQDINTVSLPADSYNLALLVDATHHLSDQENLKLFGTLGRIADKVAIFDPVKQRRLNLIGRFLTALDRGCYIRAEKDLLALVAEKLNIEKVIRLKIMGVQGVCVLARSRNSS